MAVDVVVVNYHTDDLLADFIRSYEAHKFEGCTITVVEVERDPTGADPYSTPVPFTGIDRLLIFGENVGYAKACNAGAEKGTNDVILLANADTLLSAGFEECYNALTHPLSEEWGVLGPRQVDERGRFTAGGIFGTDTNIGQRGWQEQDVGQFSDIREDAKSVSGSLYFIKRGLWEELTNCPVMQQFSPGIKGAFIETQHYYEETACSYHARAHGAKIVFYGPVQMIHLWHKASERGGWADMQVDKSKAMMRTFLGLHGITCE